MRLGPIVLLIFDGWGIRPEKEGNAILQANPATYLNLLEKYPNIALDVAGEAVGLPKGQMGNSEVGHMNMGAGRVVYQELTRIDKAVNDGSFFSNDVFLQAITHAKQHQSALHLMGLISDGGVHSSLNHALSLITMAKQQGVETLYVHAFLDGRDTPQKSAWNFVKPLEEHLLDLDYEQVASVIGRYYAMDRDKRWDRVEKAYDAIVSGEGTRHLFSEDAIQYAYRQDTTDEFVPPSCCNMNYHGMQDNDAVIFFNFRPDRARQLIHALGNPDFDGFERKKTPTNLHVACMSPYDDALSLPVAFPKDKLPHVLGKVLSEHDLRQFHTAETEKYAHVTYFFNGGEETPFPCEERVLVPSPKVATYDLQPEMSLPEVTSHVVKAIEGGAHEFVVCNFANSDMVGHTGNFDAAVQAVQHIDQALARVVDAVLANNGILMVTADHGNIETMISDNGTPHTAHTTNPVPFILASNHQEMALANNTSFSLANIAPTILDILAIEKPSAMTACSMLSHKPSTLSV